MKKHCTLFAIFIFLLLAPVANAYVTPTFPTCSNPSGDLKVKYDSGQHAINGEQALRSGSDAVYWEDNQNALQCFCPDQGMGIQTNWWKITDLTQEDINSLTKQGWNYIPTGRDWGLADDPYLAKNVDYTCNAGDSGSSDSGSSSSSGGETLSTSTSSGSVLGLAGTGDNYVYIAFLSLGIALTLGGIKLRRNS